MTTDDNEGDKPVRIQLSLSPEAGVLLERIMQWRFPMRARVHSLTIEQLIREEAKRIEEERRKQQKS